MEKTSPRSLYHYFTLAELVGFMVFDSMLVSITRLRKLSLSLFTCSSRIHGDRQKMNTSSEAEMELRREELEMVVERIGMSFSQEGEKLKDCMGFNELSTIFEEKEPSLEEVKLAFCVFDDNCDGFIDAVELQKVLCKLGFNQEVELDACKLMIAPCDENQDGRIDIHEFIRFMENSFC